MMRLISAAVQLLRPQQWAKNMFIFLPLFFSGQLLHSELVLFCAISFFAFSFIASSIYVFNDICDIENDRKHPVKCKRPIASGKISKLQAYIIMAVCIIVSFLFISYFAGIKRYMLIGLILFYFLMNIAYSVKLKHLVIVDVMIIALGFVLRVIVGGISTGIELSEWIVLMTFLLALFLAFAKRRDDVVIFQSSGVIPRKNTNKYTLDFMNQIITSISTITIIAYIMYTMSPEVIGHFNSKYVYTTSFFVLAGIIRYLQLTMVYLKSGSPTKILIKDRFIQLCIIGWIITFFIIIYWQKIRIINFFHNSELEL